MCWWDLESVGLETQSSHWSCLTIKTSCNAITSYFSLSSYSKDRSLLRFYNNHVITFLRGPSTLVGTLGEFASPESHFKRPPEPGKPSTKHSSVLGRRRQDQERRECPEVAEQRESSHRTPTPPPPLHHAKDDSRKWPEHLSRLSSLPIQASTMDGNVRVTRPFATGLHRDVPYSQILLKDSTDYSRPKVLQRDFTYPWT